MTFVLSGRFLNPGRLGAWLQTLQTIYVVVDMSGFQRTGPAAPHPHSPKYLLHVCCQAIWKARGCQATIISDILQNGGNHLRIIFHIVSSINVYLVYLYQYGIVKIAHIPERLLCGSLPKPSWGGKSSLEGCHSIKMPWPTSLLPKKYKDT